MKKNTTFWSFTWKKIAVITALCCLVYLFWLPDVSELKTKNPATTAYIQLRIKQAARQKKKFSPVMRWRSLDNISDNLVHAVVIAEDEAFYYHKGIAWKQLREAIKTNIKKKKFAIGASTISQQLARNLYLSPSKNILRKIKEMIIAKMLEREVGKRRILEIYLNVAEWGKGIFGAEAAANAYFGKSAAALTPEEGAALASILPSPRKWSPVNPGRYVERRVLVILNRMHRSGYMSEEDETTPVQAESVEVSTTQPAALSVAVSVSSATGPSVSP